MRQPDHRSHEGDQGWSLCRFVGGPAHGVERWVLGYPTTLAPMTLYLDGCAYMRLAPRGSPPATVYVPVDDHLVITQGGHALIVDAGAGPDPLG